MPPRAPHALALAVLAAHGCSAREPPPAIPARTGPPSPQAFHAGARYLAVSPTWIERAEGGADHVLAGGRRLVVRRFAVERAAEDTMELDGGAKAPAWMPPRYVFWRGQKLFGATTFTGALTPIATLPATPIGAFDWLDGIGLRFANGVVVVPANGAPRSLGVATATHALALDGRRALALTALGRAAWTGDGGASFRDVDELRAGSSLEVRGDEIAVTLRDGRERFVTSTGAIVEGVGHAAGPRRGRRPVDDAGAFPGGSAAQAIELAITRGLPSDEGGAVVADEAIAGRLDLASLRMTSIASIAGVGAEDCVAFQAADAPLLACADEARATIIDLSGAPRVERTFDLAGAPERVRFTGADGEAIGYLGPCDGPAEPSRELSPNAEPLGFPREQSATFCVRARRDEWVEHRLDAADANDVFAWIPRAGGAAAALVARLGATLPDHERVSVRGALRVVRVGRTEPPLSLSPYGGDAASTLDRSMRVGANDTIEGWIPASGSPTGVVAVSIDAYGRARAWPSPPLAGSIVTAGRLALTRGDDGKLWETIDGGHAWREVEPPPSDEARPSSCSPIGCNMSPFARLGWTSTAPAEAARVRAAPRRLTSSPVLRLTCTFDGTMESKRSAHGEGFGLAPPPPRTSPLSRLGTIGAAAIPHGGRGAAPSGAVELAWVTPLDTSGALHRSSLPLTRLDPAWAYPGGADVRLGWLLTDRGELDAIALGRGEHCPEQALALAGVVRAIGGCADEPTIAVEIGGRTFAIHVAYQSISVSTGTTAPRTRSPSPAKRGAKAALEPLSLTPLGAPTRGLAVGAGARGGAPVIVVVDVGGDAVIAPIDPTTGTIGPEARLRPLYEATLGSDRACAPRPDDARVALPFEGLISLDPSSLRGVTPTSGAGVAILRWSRDRACLDAIELPAHDDRIEELASARGRSGSLHKLIARFAGGPARATMLAVSLGLEARQALACTRLAASRGE